MRRVTVCTPEAGDSVPEAVCAALPNVARLEFARLTGAKEAQAQIAGSLLKSFTAVCGVIGLQPIPLADMPVLTTLQTLMVGLIIYTTGKPVTARTFGEFLGALGLNIGAGILFREGARAMIDAAPADDSRSLQGLAWRTASHRVFHRRHSHQRVEKTLSQTPAWMDAFKRRRLPA
jgi:hypothetical protein